MEAGDRGSHDLRLAHGCRLCAGRRPLLARLANSTPARTALLAGCDGALAFLCINKQLDLQTLFTDIARALAKVQGWYADAKLSGRLYRRARGRVRATVLMLVFRSRRDRPVVRGAVIGIAPHPAVRARARQLDRPHRLAARPAPRQLEGQSRAGARQHRDRGSLRMARRQTRPAGDARLA